MTTIPKDKRCFYCKGKGKVRYYHGDLDTCPDCHGTGIATDLNNLDKPARDIGHYLRTGETR